MEVILSIYPEELSFAEEIEKNVRLAAEKTAELYGVPTAEVSITLTNNAYIHELNKKYRQIDRPTDVLSFALNESDEPEVEDGPEINVLGDIIISVNVQRSRLQSMVTACGGKWLSLRSMACCIFLAMIIWRKQTVWRWKLSRNMSWSSWAYRENKHESNGEQYGKKTA